jgi:lysophospholipase L1-like esterase
MISATIVALGDSTTAGTPGFQSPIEVPPDGAGNAESQYAYWLMRAHSQWRVLNHGVNGERSDQIRLRFVRDVLSLPVDLVVVIAGVNDIYQHRPVEHVERELAAIFDLAASRQPRLPIVAGSILPFNGATAKQNHGMIAVNQWIQNYANRCPHIEFCDTRAAVAHPEDPNCLVSSPDGLHPSPEGYRLMAIALEPVIRRALARIRMPDL